MDMKLTEDVVKHLNACSVMVGRHAEDDFSQDTFCEYSDLSISSPIEQLFYASFKSLLQINNIPTLEVTGIEECRGMGVSPQYHIPPYRVDFHIAWFGYVWRVDALREVVVECDSQEWHERTEKERRYEKKRDREMAKQGLHTFRFTGKEIKEDPFKPAIEVCSFLTGVGSDLLTSTYEED